MCVCVCIVFIEFRKMVEVSEQPQKRKNSHDKKLARV